LKNGELCWPLERPDRVHLIGRHEIERAFNASVDAADAVRKLLAAASAAGARDNATVIAVWPDALFGRHSLADEVFGKQSSAEEPGMAVWTPMVECKFKSNDAVIQQSLGQVAESR
jgi:hypothetical protein